MLIVAWFFILLGSLLAIVGPILCFLDAPTGELDLVGAVIGSVLFVVIGGLIFLGGRWLLNRVPPETVKIYVLEPGDTRFIKSMLLRTRRIYLSLGVFLLAFAALMTWVAMQPESSPRPPEAVRFTWFEIVFGGATLLLCYGVAALFLYVSFKHRDPSATQLYRVLMETPDKVTGLTVHLYQHEDAPGTVGRQVFAAMDIGGEELRVAVTEEHRSLLRQYIQLHSPQASYQEVEHAVR